MKMLISKPVQKAYLILNISASLFFQLSSGIRAEQEDFITMQKRFVRDLYSSGRYFDCIAETRRLINLSADAGEIDNLNYFIEANYFFGGQYRTVMSHAGKGPYADFHPYAFLVSQSYLKINDGRTAFDHLKRIKYSDSAGPANNDLFYRRIEALIYISGYDDIIHEIKEYEEYSGLIQDGMKKDIIKYTEAGTKSKWLSPALSAVIPGSGQIYSGRHADGIISLLSIIGAAYGAYYFHGRGDTPLAMTFGFFGALFYCGNIYGAYNSAVSAGMESEARFRNEFTGKYIPAYNPAAYFKFERTFQ